MNRISEMVDAGRYELEELSIEVTGKCSTRCIHCSSGSQPKAMPHELHT